MAGDSDKIRELGEVWREDWHSKKPWKVQGPGAIASFTTRKAAKAIGELFKKEQERQNEYQRTLNEGTDSPHPIDG